MAPLVAGAVLISSISTTPAAQPMRLALLPLAPASTGLEYEALPRAEELRAMTAQLRAGLVDGGVQPIPVAVVARAVASHGFDQASLERSCAAMRCAQTLGRAVGADAVAFGRVTRQMALIWSTEVTVIDVRTGRRLAGMQAGYKGDALAMAEGETTVGTCVARALTGKPACPRDPGF